MSYYDDYEEQYIHHHPCEIFEMHYNEYKNTWTTKTGKEMKLSEMTISHLENVIRMMRREGFSKEFYVYKNFLKELESRETPLFGGKI